MTDPLRTQIRDAYADVLQNRPSRWEDRIKLIMNEEYQGDPAIRIEGPCNGLDFAIVFRPSRVEVWSLDQSGALGHRLGDLDYLYEDEDYLFRELEGFLQNPLGLGTINVDV